MPTFMDRHDVPASMTAEEVAAGHRKDVENQDRFGAKFRTYWLTITVLPSSASSRRPTRPRLCDAIASLMAMMVSQPPSFRSILPRLRPSSGARTIQARAQRRKPRQRCARSCSPTSLDRLR